MFTSTFAAGPRPWALNPGVLRPLIDSYVADLASRGYEAATIHHLEHSARHFCYWLNHSGIAVSQTDDQVIKRFTEHRCHCPGYRASEILSAAFAGMVQKFIGFLEESHFVHRAAPSICDPCPGIFGLAAGAQRSICQTPGDVQGGRQGRVIM